MGEKWRSRVHAQVKRRTIIWQISNYTKKVKMVFYWKTPVWLKKENENIDSKNKMKKRMDVAFYYKQPLSHLY